MMDLISNGPSARDYDGRGAARELVVGVNRAAAMFECGWWAFVSWRMFATTVTLGHPTRWTTSDTQIFMMRHDHEAHSRFQFGHNIFGDLAARELDQVVPKWYAWSGTLALGLVWHQAPDVCRVWGMDLAGEDGLHTNEHSQRTADRWRTERQVVAKLVGECERRGVEFEWHCEPGI